MRLLKNGKIVTTDGIEAKEILFDNEKIIALGENLLKQENLKEEDIEIQDCKGLAIIPGLIDVHVHLREPGFEDKETIETGTKSAARGGFTIVCPMPNLKPTPDSIENIKKYLKIIEEKALVRVYPYACITMGEKGEKIVDIPEIKKMGINWFSDDGVGVSSEETMEKAMMIAKEEDVMIVAHTEDMNYREKGSSVHDSEINRQRGYIGIPSICETAQLKRDINMTEKIGNKYHACHISAKESVEALREAKKKGINVTGEVTAHHLLLEDVDVQGTNWKMNPPLREHKDRIALIEGLEDGALDFIANDHAPHTKQDKDKPMSEAAFGIVSLETSFPLLYTEFVEKQKRWSLNQLVGFMATKPAKRFELEGLGEIKIGFKPDFTIIDLEKEYVIKSEEFESKGKNTPFENYKVKGKVLETIVSGQTVWKEKERY